MVKYLRKHLPVVSSAVGRSTAIPVTAVVISTRPWRGRSFTLVTRFLYA